MAKGLERLSIKLGLNIWGTDDRNSRDVEFDGSAHCATEQIEEIIRLKLKQHNEALRAWLDSASKAPEETLFLRVELVAILVEEDTGDVPGEQVELTLSHFPDTLQDCRKAGSPLADKAADKFMMLLGVLGV